MEGKICVCGSNYETCESLCPSCNAKSLGTFWVAQDNSRISMYSDGNQFIATINAGLEGETYLSVGYSSPNYAWIESWMILEINRSLDSYWAIIKEKPLDEMLSALYGLCHAANRGYNKCIDIGYIKKEDCK